MNVNPTVNDEIEILPLSLMQAVALRIKWWLLGRVALCIIGTILLGYLPRLVGNLIGALLISQEATYTAVYSLIGANVLLTVTWFLDDILLAWCNPKTKKHLTDILGAHVLYQNKRYFTDHNSGEIVTALMDAGHALPTMIDAAFVILVCCGAILSYVYLAYQSHMYAGIMMTIWCLAWLIVTYISTIKGIRHAQNCTKKNLEMLGHTSNVLDNIMCVHSAAAETHEGALLSVRSQTTQHAECIMELVTTAGNTSQIATIVVVDAVFYLVMCRLFFTGDVQIADITQFSTIISILFNITRHVSRQVKYFIDSYGRYVTTIGLLGKRVKRCSANQPLILPEGDIIIKDLTFTHCNLEDGLFKNISLRIKKGETVGFVGRSGSGKTTLVNLLMGHYDRGYTGSIHIGAQNIKDLSIAQLRRCIAHVPQQVTLFQRSAYDNIAYGCDGISASQVVAAAKQGCADAFISKLPNGYETALNTKGVELSGGQRQRILLSRAMAQMHHAKILVLDEGTSALDTETEKEVAHAVSSVLGKTEKTCIVVAHRLSTLSKADRIVVFDNGRIVEMGTHKELIAKPGSAYEKLCRAAQLE